MGYKLSLSLAQGSPKADFTAWSIAAMSAALSWKV